MQRSFVFKCQTADGLAVVRFMLGRSQLQLSAVQVLKLLRRASVHGDRGRLRTAACEADGVVLKMVLFKDVSELRQAVGSASQQAERASSLLKTELLKVWF